MNNTLPHTHTHARKNIYTRYRRKYQKSHVSTLREERTTPFFSPKPKKGVVYSTKKAWVIQQKFFSNVAYPKSHYYPTISTSSISFSQKLHRAPEPPYISYFCPRITFSVDMFRRNLLQRRVLCKGRALFLPIPILCPIV